MEVFTEQSSTLPDGLTHGLSFGQLVDLYTTKQVSRSTQESLEHDLNIYLNDASNRMYTLHELLTPAHKLTSDVVMFVERMVSGDVNISWPALRSKLDDYFECEGGAS